jgi:TPP-dependent pyruvate/acetoin dehydrogenase alpha subunit
MRSTQDPIKGLQKYLEEWGVTSEDELKVIGAFSTDLMMISGFSHTDWIL